MDGESTFQAATERTREAGRELGISGGESLDLVLDSFAKGALLDGTTKRSSFMAGQDNTRPAFANG